MKKLLALISLFAITGSPVLAQDFSLSPLVPKQPILTSSRCSSSLAVNISTATTTLLVDVNANALPFHVCKFVSSVVGTTPTVKFEYGTGTACGTGTTVSTGTVVVTTGTVFTSAVQIDVPASQQFCLVSGGTTPSIQGVFEYGYW